MVALVVLATLAVSLWLSVMLNRQAQVMRDATADLQAAASDLETRIERLNARFAALNAHIAGLRDGTAGPPGKANPAGRARAGWVGMQVPVREVQIDTGTDAPAWIYSTDPATLDMLQRKLDR